MHGSTRVVQLRSRSLGFFEESFSVRMLLGEASASAFEVSTISHPFHLGVKLSVNLLVNNDR
jgi:hypothetical protein